MAFLSFACFTDAIARIPRIQTLKCAAEVHEDKDAERQYMSTDMKPRHVVKLAIYIKLVIYGTSYRSQAHAENCRHD